MIPVLRKLKQRLLPPSSRSFHEASDRSQAKLHEIRAELSDLRQLVIEQAEQIKNLQACSDNLLEAHRYEQQRDIMMYWQQYRRVGESLEDAQLRFFRALPKATGISQLFQDAEAQLFVEFDEFCKKHDILYWATGGTVLGAYRQQDFIPWDDDIDVYIARDQLNKLKKATEEDDRYRITVVWDWYVPCKQIRFRLSDVDNPCFVDLFTLDWVQGNPKTAWEFGQEQRREFTNSIRMQFKDTDWSQILYIDDSNPLVPKLEQMLNERIEELGTHITVLSDQEHATALVRGPENIDEGHSSGPYPIDEWLPLDYLRFRNMSVPVPNMWRQYLHRLYGDYMSIPHDISSHEHVANDYINSAQSKAAMNRFLGRL